MKEEKNETLKEEKKETIKEEKNKSIFDEYDLFAEDNKKHKKKVKISLIIFSVLFLLIGAIIMASSMLFSGDSKKTNNKNIDYLVNTYGDKVTISFLNKRKDIYSYKLCSKKISFCVPVAYNEKNDIWSYPKGESFVNILLFMDYAVGILENNNIEYETYTDVGESNNLPDNLVLVIKKENEGSLTSAITNINGSSLINNICGNDGNCNAHYHITIFNANDYDIITKALNDMSSVKNYTDLYEILFKNDGDEYGTRLGENIQRHNIGGNMFSCTDEDCSKHKHIAYRYVPGNHNHVGSTIIVEGVN